MRKVSLAILIPLLIGILTVAFNTQLAFTQSTTITVPDDFPTIQEAVNAANPGYIIYVRAGTYYERVTIDKNNLALIGESKHTTIIDGGGGNYSTVKVSNVDFVEISGFTIQNSYDGIYISSSYFVTVSGNTITNSTNHGIILAGSSSNTISENILTNSYDGIELYNSSYTTVSGNTITNSRFGIGTSVSSSNTFSENTLTSNYDGLYIYNSSSATISDNTITNSTNHGISLIISSNCNFSGNTIINSTYQGILLDSSSSCNVSGNTITNNINQGIRLQSSSNSTISENTLTNNFYGIYIHNSSYATVSGNTITNSTFYGIRLQSSSFDTFSGNNITGSSEGGILLSWSPNNTIYENTITNNGVGFSLYVSGDSIFYHNNFIDNTIQTLVTSSNCTWDDGYPSGGNYWSNYADVDVYSGPYQNETGSDQIWDTPYVIDAENQDNYPLVEPWTKPEHQLTVLCYDNNGQTASVPLYIDGQYVGTTMNTYNVTEGSHTLSVPQDIPPFHSFYSWYYDDYVYNPTITVEVYSNRTIIAYYYLWYR